MVNRLAKEKSPYLLQHAHNPVDWYPWGKEAFDKAKKENKPIFLSIGYSTCHWCHVMETESFEDDDVAELMNEVFVCIKVDREERPDLDGIYMKVCQMMTGSGGWPLTIIMTPDKKPFFAGTYFSKTGGFGRMGMFDLIPHIKEMWTLRKKDVHESAERIITLLRESSQHTAGDELGSEVIEHAYREISSRFDSTYGGFGTAPKFPTPHQLLLLLRYWKRNGEERALKMVEKTLQEMRKGGIYDHVGHGFHRYSTDRRWFLPHFEKMLYDQALLAMAYLETYQATGKEEYAESARGIFTYILRDMTSPKGAFYSAEDADSEGEEGKFYVWSEEELKKILGAADAGLVQKVFNTTLEGNFIEEGVGKQTGTNILHLTKSMSDLVSELGMKEEGLRERLSLILQKLFMVREKRVHPFKDDKILTDWNGLMISALAKGAQVLGEPTYAKAASKAAAFVLSHMTRKGRLLHRFRKGEADITANVDDYAFFITGLLDLYEATFEVVHLKKAVELTDQLLELFWDNEHNGFFFTPNDGEDLIVRNKEFYDGAVPSGNSVAMLALLRQSRMTGRQDLKEKASLLSKAFSRDVARQPAAHTQLLLAVDFALGSQEVVLVGKKGGPDTLSLLSALRKEFLPNKVVLMRTDDLVPLSSFTKDLKSKKGKATAYVCKDFRCDLPVTDPAKMVELLK